MVADALSRMLSPPEAEQLQLPGDNFPLKQQNTVYQLPVGKADPRSEWTSGSKHCKNQAVFCTRLHSFACAFRRRRPRQQRHRARQMRHSPAPIRSIARCERWKHSCRTSSIRLESGYVGLASPLHRRVLIGGYTRRTANADKSTGGERADAGIHSDVGSNRRPRMERVCILLRCP